ncbi:hypothetical protein HK104_009540 [Borealophlyctis nickersoniae]|nr:hypothetical protein HK104_009540 [Borealophlyctis nickersoniae]
MSSDTFNTYPFCLDPHPPIGLEFLPWVTCVVRLQIFLEAARWCDDNGYSNKIDEIPFENYPGYATLSDEPKLQLRLQFINAARLRTPELVTRAERNFIKLRSMSLKAGEKANGKFKDFSKEEAPVVDGSVHTPVATDEKDWQAVIESLEPTLKYLEYGISEAEFEKWLMLGE